MPTVTIIECRSKAYKVQAADGFTFWIQRRKNPATEGTIEITAAAEAKARAERAEFVAQKQAERARAATVLTLPAPDWESDTCLGFDFHDCYFGPGRDHQRLRVFVSREKAAAGITWAEMDAIVTRALAKVGAVDAVLGCGPLAEVMRNA